jgi:hypothetical protein
MYSPTSTPRVIVAPAVADLVPLTRLNARFLEIAFVLVHLDHVAVENSTGLLYLLLALRFIRLRGR